MALSRERPVKRRSHNHSPGLGLRPPLIMSPVNCRCAPVLTERRRPATTKPRDAAAPARADAAQHSKDALSVGIVLKTRTAQEVAVPRYTVWVKVLAVPVGVTGAVGLEAAGRHLHPLAIAQD